MALDRMFWMDEHFFRRVWGAARAPDISGGHDVHVLLGTTSRDLRQGIGFYDPARNRSWAWGTTHVTDRVVPDGLRFVPRFAVQGQVGHRIDGHGVEVDEETGAVTAVAPGGTLRLRNFILEVTAKIKDPPGSVDEKQLDPIRMRVHIHDEVVRWWLTPSPLTIHRGSPGQRFSVLAELATDGQPEPPMVADISRIAGITWSSTSPDVTITHGGIDSTATGPATITATLPAAWGGTAQSADVDVIEGWHERSPRASLRAGPGSDRLMEVPNVLLLSDGFTSAQEDDWDQLVTRLVDEIRHGRVYRPYDLFLENDSINIWSVFIPSREPGSSFLSEVFAKSASEGASLQAVVLPTPLIFPKPEDAAWSLLGLFAQVGLPVRSDAGATAATHADKLTEWQGLYGAAEVPAAKATETLYALWRDWALRTLIDERDTALGIAYGGRPKAERAHDERFPDFHPFRTSFEDLQIYLARLTDGDGPLIGPAFASGSSPGSGKDAGRVAVLVAGGRYGGYRERILTASLHRDATLNLERLAVGFRHRTVPHPIPSVSSGLWDVGPGVTPSARGIVVHEISHSFSLEDEYATFTHEPLPASRVASLLTVGNVQPAEELVTPGVGSASDRLLVGDNLRWRWPRIARAAVLSEIPIQTGTEEFVLSLRWGQKRRFRNGDIVFLRQRPLLQKPAAGAAAIVRAKVSVPLEVISDAQTEEQIVVRTADPTFLPADFPAIPPFESIVFVPVPAPAYAAAAGEQHADLVPRVVREHITTTGRPLNRTAAQTCVALVDGDNDRAMLRNAPDDVDPFWIQEWVGAFDGGDEYACGIFHASNHCLMRVSSDVTGTFCPVCRYLLVDAVDPSLHGEVDEAYTPFYVEPES